MVKTILEEIKDSLSQTLSNEEIQNEIKINNREKDEFKSEAYLNAFDHKIIFTDISRKGAKNPISYHFHFLLTEKHGTPMAICLDTSDEIPLSSKDPDREEMKSIIHLLVDSFLEKAGSIDRDINLVRAGAYFKKADDMLWKKFNHLKEEKFVEYALKAIIEERSQTNPQDYGIKTADEVEISELLGSLSQLGYSGSLINHNDYIELLKGCGLQVTPRTSTKTVIAYNVALNGLILGSFNCHPTNLIPFAQIREYNDKYRNEIARFFPSSSMGKLEKDASIALLNFNKKLREIEERKK